MVVDGWTLTMHDGWITTDARLQFTREAVNMPWQITAMLDEDIQALRDASLDYDELPFGLRTLANLACQATGAQYTLTRLQSGYDIEEVGFMVRKNKTSELWSFYMRLSAFTVGASNSVNHAAFALLENRHFETREAALEALTQAVNRLQRSRALRSYQSSSKRAPRLSTTEFRERREDRIIGALRRWVAS